MGQYLYWLNYMCSDGYIFSVWCAFIYSLLIPLNNAIYIIVISPNIVCLRNTEQDESHLYFLFHCKLCKTTPNYITKLINLNCNFNTPFKVNLKAIIMETLIHFLDGVLLQIFPDLWEVFLRHYISKRKALMKMDKDIFISAKRGFDEDGYEKINKLSNFKCSPASRISKLRDSAIELGSKNTFLKTLNSILNNHGSFNMQFN